MKVTLKHCALILFSFFIISCDDDNNNGSGGTPVFKNDADTLEGVYTVSYRAGGTMFNDFNTQITASKTVENEFTFSRLQPFTKVIPARLNGNDIVIDTIYDTSVTVCNGVTQRNPFQYYGSGTIMDSIVEIKLKRGFLYEYSFNLNE